MGFGSRAAAVERWKIAANLRAKKLQRTDRKMQNWRQMAPKTCLGV
jgi:hypothetical protein